MYSLGLHMFPMLQRMLEERRREYGDKRMKEREYVHKLEKTDDTLKVYIYKSPT